MILFSFFIKINLITLLSVFSVITVSLILLFYSYKLKIKAFEKNFLKLLENHESSIISVQEFNQTFRLIQEKIESLKLLSNQSSKLYELFDISNDYFEDGIIFLDNKGIIQRFNRKIIDFFDRKLSEIDTYKKITDLTSNIDFIEFFEKSKTNKINTTNIQTNFPQRNFNLRSINLDEITVVIIKDISEFISLDKTRREFFANTSHELKTPVTSIKLNVQALKNSLKLENKDDFEYFLEKIDFDADRLQKITSDIGQLHSLESGSIKISIDELSIDEFMKGFLLNIETLLSSKRMKIKISKKNNFNKIKIDNSLFFILLENIISNSIRYSQENSNIEIDMQKNKTTFSISIKDHGIGVSQIDLPHIFERFYRGDGLRSDHHNGLGLAIVKHIVDLHKGTIEASSEINQGLNITIKFPQ